MRNQVWTISTLVRYLKNSLDNDMNIQSILVKGEISNFTNHKSGHLYFSLKDSGGKLSCVMFSSYASRLKIALKEGMKVIVQAKLSMYEPQGTLQLYVSAIQSDGLGDLYLQFEQLKEKLSKEGLFEQSHKKPLPLYPKNIAIISARTGAAIQDVLSIIARRWPIADVCVYPSLVQGDKASENIIQNLVEADKQQHDIILLVRGGGSIEDLWCFNNELLARTIYDMNTCVVSGVGHETDTTLVDYVSDQRAPTPSAAAELITPNRIEVKEMLQSYQLRMQHSILRKIDSEKTKINHIKNKAMFSSAEYFIQQDKLRLMMVVKSLFTYEKQIQMKRQQLESKQEALYTTISKVAKENRLQLQSHINLLDAFSPLKILKRGYSIAMHEQSAVRSIHDVKENETIQLLVNDGTIYTRVEKGVPNDRK